MAADSSPVDPNRCPLCGQSNACANEEERRTGMKQPPCWCTSVDFSADLLARVPAQAQRIVCICARCAAGEAAASSVFSPPGSPPTRDRQ